MTSHHVFITGTCGAIGRRCVGAARRCRLLVSGLGHGQWEAEARDETIDLWTTGDVNIPSLYACCGVRWPD
jgi:hypothetical protein